MFIYIIIGNYTFLLNWPTPGNLILESITKYNCNPIHFETVIIIMLSEMELRTNDNSWKHPQNYPMRMIMLLLQQ